MLNIKLDGNQSCETLLPGPDSVLSDLSRLAPTNMTAIAVMEEMVIMAITQLIPATHHLYPQQLGKSTITFYKLSELIL